MSKATVEAERLLEDLGLHQLPVDPHQVCEAMSSSHYQITINEQPMDSEGFHGISMGDANGAAILINEAIANPHRKRFTAAHEIGHVHLHIQTNQQSQFQCTATNLSSNNNQNSNFEKEANEFASSLLMPASIIASEIHQNDLSWALIENIQKRCNVSLEAAARRVIALSKDACCLIIHKENDMWFPIKSQSFNAFLPTQSFPGDLSTSPDNNESDSLPNDMDECEFSDWNFPDKASTGQLFYSSIHNSEFNRTMTLLLHEEDTEEDEDHDNEPRFS
mgnify:CR=1 FL=1